MDTAHTDPTTHDLPTFAVWYAAAGCLPDVDGPQYVGDFEHCTEFVAEQLELYPEPAHSTYSYSIEPWTDTDEDDFYGDHNDSLADERLVLDEDGYDGPADDDDDDDFGTADEPTSFDDATDHIYDPPAADSIYLTGLVPWDDSPNTRACSDMITNIVFGQLIKLAVEHPQHPVRHYYSDFGHDMRWLMTNLEPGLQFGFCFDDCGTWVFRLDQPDSDAFMAARRVAYTCRLRAEYPYPVYVQLPPDADDATFDACWRVAERTTSANWFLDVTPVTPVTLAEVTR